MAKIEILFPELCSLYGEIGTVNYLIKFFDSDEHSVVLSRFDARPTFADSDVDFIYLGPMSEKWQPKIIEKLKPHAGRLRELIESGCVFWTIGGGFEVFGSYIEDKDKSKISGLEIFDYHAVLDFSHRYNQKMLLKYDSDYVIGTKSQFSQVYGVDDSLAFMDCVKGNGNNPDSKKEGFKYKNFYGTHLQGPILLCNPKLTSTLLLPLAPEKSEILFNDIITDSHKARLKYNL